VKKAIFIAVLFLCADTIFCVSANAQDCTADFLGTKTLYKNPRQRPTLAPTGYEAVFINHVGRHGARHLTKDVKTTSAYTLVMTADSLNALTENGRKLKQMVIALQKVEKGNTKNISAEGRDELFDIGRRLYIYNKSVFNGQVNLNVAVTKEVRTEQSADAFLKGLNARLKDSAKVKRYNDDVHLRFYDLSPAYKKFEDGVDEDAVKQAVEKANNIDELNNAFAARFFNTDFLGKLDDTKKAKFTLDVLGYATIVYSLNAEIKAAGFTAIALDFKSLFTCDELSRLGAVESIDENLKKGPGTNNNGIQVRVAVPLLVDFINTTDDFIKTKKVNAQLRFAHAETIAPFAALLEIADANKAAKQPAALAKNWQASKIIPLSANIQWIFYKKKNSGDYLVKILLNEKEVRVTGLGNKSFPYYKWGDLRILYLNKLTRLGVKLSDNMSAYLSDIK
jgi:hypothetical protein